MQAWNTKHTMTEYCWMLEYCWRGTWLTRTHKRKWMEKVKRAEEKHAEDARRKGNRDKWDKDTAHIKRVLLADEEPLLTDNQKLILNHIKTYLLENERGFQQWKRILLSMSGIVLFQIGLELFSVPCLRFTGKKNYPQLKFLFFYQHFFGGWNVTLIRCCIFYSSQMVCTLGRTRSFFSTSFSLCTDFFGP